MRLRYIILILALFSMLSVSFGGILYYYSFKKKAFEQTEADAYSRLTLVADQLSFYLSENIKPTYTLSQMAEMRQALAHKTLDTLWNANQILDTFTRSLQLEVSYLMDQNGVTICSSNRNQKDSFVDKNFSFRPYFQKAIQGESSTYLALGSTSKIRGVYHSSPVFDQKRDRILGVAVIKASVEFVESRLFPKSDNILLLTNPEGMIFISNQPDLRFKLLWQLTEEEIDTIADSRQFGNGPWPWVGFSKNDKGVVLDRDSTRYLFSNHDVANFPGWKIINLRNYQQIERLVADPFVKVIGPVIFSILFLTGTIVFILYQHGIKELHRRREAEKKLRTSEERYRLELEEQVKRRTHQLEKAQENLKNMSKNIIASQEREKANTARELHDHLGQILTALKIDGVWLNKYLSDLDEKAVVRVEKMCVLIDNTINDVRDMAYRLRPRMLDDLGLVDALESLVDDFEKRSNVSCVFKCDHPLKLDTTLETALYRIAQEAVTNALRHSNATAVMVELKTGKNHIELSIQDDGCGFDTSNNKKKESFGLEGMKERANLIGGDFTITSSPSRGTHVCCRLTVT